MKIALERPEKPPEIVAEMVKPAEKIDTIRVHRVSGHGAAGYGGGSSETGDKPPVNQALDSIMGMAVQLPALKMIGEDLGILLENGGSGVIEKVVAAVELTWAEPKAETSPDAAQTRTRQPGPTPG